VDVTACLVEPPRRAQNIFDLFMEDSPVNVYAGEREVRPPGAPTIEPTERVAMISSCRVVTGANH
jgi:hypothetical protein